MSSQLLSAPVYPPELLLDVPLLLEGSHAGGCELCDCLAAADPGGGHGGQLSRSGELHLNDGQGRTALVEPKSKPASGFGPAWEAQSSSCEWAGSVGRGGAWLAGWRAAEVDGRVDG